MSCAMQVDAAPYHLVQRLFGFLVNDRALIGQLLRFATKPNYALRGSFPFGFFRHSIRPFRHLFEAKAIQFSTISSLTLAS